MNRRQKIAASMIAFVGFSSASTVGSWLVVSDFSQVLAEWRERDYSFLWWESDWTPPKALALPTPTVTVTLSPDPTPVRSSASPASRTSTRPKPTPTPSVETPTPTPTPSPTKKKPKPSPSPSLEVEEIVELLDELIDRAMPTSLDEVPEKWQRLAFCESTNRLDAVSPSGRHHGLWQIERGWFEGLGITSGPPYSFADQWRAALHVYEVQGARAWSCAKRANFD
jgi:hypothetical protein